MSSMRNSLNIGVLLGLSALATSACSSDSSPGNDGTAAGGSGGGASMPGGASNAGAPANPNDDAVGTFAVRLDARQSITTVSGVVRDGPAIELVPFLPDRKSGSCQLFLPKVPFCDPVCAANQVCDPVGDVCKARPTNHSVGTVTIEGLATEDGSNEFTMDPIGSSKAYNPSSSVRIQYPPTESGAPVRLTATGGDFAPFEIQTIGIASLEGFSGDPLPLDSGQPFPLTWTAEPGASVEVVLEIAHHGGQKGKVICNAEDTGSLVIPADLVTELIGLGVAGFPDVSLTRKSVGSTTIALGRVELMVSAGSTRQVAIAGLTSCMTDEECPDGEVCGQDKACAAP